MGFTKARKPAAKKDATPPKEKSVRSPIPVARKVSPASKSSPMPKRSAALDQNKMPPAKAVTKKATSGAKSNAPAAASKAPSKPKAAPTKKSTPTTRPKVAENKKKKVATKSAKRKATIKKIEKRAGNDR